MFAAHQTPKTTDDMSFTVYLKVLLDCCDDIKSWLAIHFFECKRSKKLYYLNLQTLVLLV